MSLTTEVFGLPSSGRDRVYYTITDSKDPAVIAALATTQTNPVVLMFWADWNIPCKVMMNPFRDMAWAKKKEAVFCRVDVDKCKDIVERFRVEALPTFLLIKQGVEKARVVGPKEEGELNTIIGANIGGSSIPPVRPVEEQNTTINNVNIGGSSFPPAWRAVPEIQIQKLEKVNCDTEGSSKPPARLVARRARGKYGNPLSAPDDVDSAARRYIENLKKRWRF